MAAKLWRCCDDRCGHRAPFEAEAGVCPQCRLPHCVELVAVHYLVPAEGPIRTGAGNRMVACDPALATLPQSTGERVAVTCPKCRATAIFAEDERDNVDNDVRALDPAIQDALASHRRN